MKERIIIEIPHRMAPTAWYTHDYDTDIVELAGCREHHIPDDEAESMTSIEVAEETVYHDLTYHDVMTIDEARNFITSYRGHQSASATVAVRDCLESYVD